MFQLYRAVTYKVSERKRKGATEINEKLQCLIVLGFFKMLLVSHILKDPCRDFYLVLKLLLNSGLRRNTIKPKPSNLS